MVINPTTAGQQRPAPGPAPQRQLRRPRRTGRVPCGRLVADRRVRPRGLSKPVNQYLVVWADGRDQATRGFDVYGRRVAG
jgi:hypothetical protein